MFHIRKNKNPLFAFVCSHVINYPTPVNLNYVWGFSSLAGLVLAIQFITGIFPALHHTPCLVLVFSRVEHIVRDANSG